MYNSYRNGSDAWWAMQEAIGAHKDLEDATDVIATTFEQIIGELDDAHAQCEEMELERDNLAEKYDEIKDKFDCFDAASSLKTSIQLLEDLSKAANAIVKYTDNKLAYVRTLEDVQKGDSDSSDGTAGDGGS